MQHVVLATLAVLEAPIMLASAIHESLAVFAVVEDFF
jgi:hypothetical protein